MLILRAFLASIVLSAVLCRSGEAQDEARLRKALEGKRITMKMDMPATSDGVDVYPGTNRPVDFEKVGKRVKKEGVAIKNGEAARITRVKVQSDIIEVQVNGGSRFNLRYPNGVDPDDLTPSAIAHALEEYATLPANVASPSSLTTATLAATPAAPKSPDAASAPEREVRTGMTTIEVASILGSPTSNIANGAITTRRYHGATGAIEVDFVNDDAVAVRKISPSGTGALRKGLSEADVEHMAGTPTSSTTKGQMVTKKYNWQDGVLYADFYNGVLVRYRTTSK
jgi:hypothetical protein